MVIVKRKESLRSIEESSNIEAHFQWYMFLHQVKGITLLPTQDLCWHGTLLGFMTSRDEQFNNPLC